jgi:hypothetical protein
MSNPFEIPVGDEQFVKCQDCGQIMDERVGCTKTRFLNPNGGESIDRIPHNKDHCQLPEGTPCHDCNVGLDQYHHPGCDMERCPLCGGQVISCGCLNSTNLKTV